LSERHKAIGLIVHKAQILTVALVSIEISKFYLFIYLFESLYPRPTISDFFNNLIVGAFANGHIFFSGYGIKGVNDDHKQLYKTSI